MPRGGRNKKRRNGGEREADCAKEPLLTWLVCQDLRILLEIVDALAPPPSTEVGLVSLHDGYDSQLRETQEVRGNDECRRIDEERLRWEWVHHARSKWLKTTVAAEFREHEKAWEALYGHLMTPEAECRSYDEIAEHLGQLALHDRSYSRDDVKYRLATVLKALRLSITDYIRENRGPLEEANIDPERAQRMLNALFHNLRPFRKLVNRCATHQDDRCQRSDQVTGDARERWIRNHAKEFDEPTIAWEMLLKFVMIPLRERPSLDTLAIRLAQRRRTLTLPRDDLLAMLRDLRKEFVQAAVTYIG